MRPLAHLVQLLFLYHKKKSNQSPSLSLCPCQCVCVLACMSQCGRRSTTPCSSSLWSSPASIRHPPLKLLWCSGGTGPTVETPRGTPSPCPRLWATRPRSWEPRPRWSAPTAAGRSGSWRLSREHL